MLVAIALILWIVDIVFHTVHYRKLANRTASSFSLYGMLMAMISSGLLTYLMAGGGSRDAARRYVHTVNGVRMSSDTYFTLEVFMTWVFVGAIMNLIAMGIGYLLTKKYRKR
jgi:hypothetical protein